MRCSESLPQPSETPDPLNFRGEIKRPFNDSAREAAGLTKDYRLALVAGGPPDHTPAVAGEKLSPAIVRSAGRCRDGSTDGQPRSREIIISIDNAAPARRFRQNGTFRRALAGAALALAAFHAAPSLAADDGVGGAYDAVDGKNSPIARADPQYRALFLSWKRLDRFQSQDSVAVPSQRPIGQVSLSSGFGVRSDPFRGGAAMHAGVDMPGSYGTPIYATADGYVGRAGWTGGYGNLVELEHGKGIETRYGHLSAILVHPGQQVRRGDLIARMGSTGRSTGNHLHYEVRIDGHAINPIPFLQTSDYIVRVERRMDGTQIAIGGPDN